MYLFITLSLIQVKIKESMKNLILFGPPGSGKGTQSAKVAEKYNLAHISTGDIFRREISNQTPLGIKVKDIISKGELVPDELLIDLLRNAIKQNSDTQGYIFDGFPRTLQQAKDLDKLMSEFRMEISKVLVLDVIEEEVVKRLLKRAELEGRSDDTEDVIRNRMQVYRNQTEPLIEYYSEKGLVGTIEGVGSINGVFDALCKEIE